MIKSEQINELVEALAKAQAGFGPLAKNKEVIVKTQGASYTFAYADLDQVLHVTRGPLLENGLTLMQTLGNDGLTTMLAHKSGQFIMDTVKIDMAGRMQEVGGRITYTRRYALTSMLGITADTDNDAQTTNPKSKKSEKEEESDIPLAEQETLNRKLSAILDYFANDDPKGAHDAFYELEPLGIERASFVWKQLGSTQRKTIKKLHEQHLQQSIKKGVPLEAH